MIIRRLALVALAIIACGAPAWANGETEGSKAVTLTYLSQEHPNTPLNGWLPVLQAIEKKTGVAIEFITAPNGAPFDEKLNITLSSGDYPDMIAASISRINDYAEKVFVHLDPLIAQGGPNLKKALTSETRALVANAEGKVYGIPRIGQPEHMLGWLVRKDWLVKAKLAEPKTLDEWVTVLKAFKTMDPDGNGQADTIPLTARGWPAYSLVGPCYGLHPQAYANLWQPDGTGIRMMLDSREYRDTLAFIRNLVEQQLLDQEFTVIKTAQWEEKMIGGKSGAAMDYLVRADMCNTAGRKIDPSYTLYVTEYPKGPTGARQMLSYTSALPGYSVGITKTSKNVAAAVRWLDFVYSDEGADLYSWGVKGVSYDVVNGTKTYLKDFARLDTALMAKLGLQPNTFPFRFDTAAVDYMYDKNYPEANAGFKRNAAWKLPQIPPLSYARDEQDFMKDWNANAVPLINQYRDGIATANRPLSDWDELVKKLKELGFDRYAEIQKTAYARFQAAAK